MNTIKSGLPGIPAYPSGIGAAPPAAPPLPPAAPPKPAEAGPVEIDLGAMLADSQQVDIGKQADAGFDVKSLNFESVASKALERIQMLRSPDSAQAVLLRVGNSKIEVPGANLSKEVLVKLLSETLSRMSPGDLSQALDLARASKPLVDQIRADKQPAKAEAPPDAPPEPQYDDASAPKTLTELFASDVDEKTFNKYSRGLFEGKLGVKSIDAGFIASYLHDALRGDTVGKRVRGLGYVMVRLHELSQRDPKVKEALNGLIAKVEGAIPERLHPVFKKMFTQKGPSLGHMNNLYTVTDGKFETAKDIYAAFELVHYFGSDVKAFLPPAAQRGIERFETLCAKELKKPMLDVLKKFVPMGINSDISIAVCKIFAGEGVARMSGAIELGKLLGLRLFGDGGQFAAMMSFAKIDIDTTVYAKQLFDPAQPPQLRAKALKNIVEIYQTRLDKFAAAFPPGTIPASVSADAAKLIALVPTDKIGMAEKLSHYGLGEPEKLEKAMEKLKGFGVENQEQLLTFLQKMGHGKADDALKAVDGLSAKGIGSLEQLGTVMQKLGASDFASLDKALGELGKYGFGQADEAVALLEQLGAKHAEQGIEALKALGIKPGKLSAEAITQNVTKALDAFKPHGVNNAGELLELMKRTGAKDLDSALAALKKTGVEIGEKGASQLTELGVKNAAQATELMAILGSKNTEAAAAMAKRFQAFGLKGEDTIKLMESLGLKGTKDAERALYLLSSVGVQASDSAADTLARVKGLGIRYLDRVGEDFAKLKSFGINTLEEAANTAKLLGIKNFDELGEGTVKLLKTGITDLKEAEKLFKTLGVANLDEALVALGKLEKLGAKNADQAIELMELLSQSKISKVDQAIELFDKLGIHSLEELDKLAPELDKLSKFGVNAGGEMLEFIGAMGGRNLKQALNALESLEKLGFSGREAIDTVKKLGLTKTGWLAATAERIGLRADSITRLGKELSSVGVNGIAEAVEMLEKTGFTKADDLIRSFKNFRISDKKMLDAVLETLGCGEDLAKLGATMRGLSAVGITSLEKALTYARKLGLENVSEAVELMGKFGAAGLKEPDEVLKLMEKLGVDLVKKEPAEVLEKLTKALPLVEEAAKYGAKGIDDVARVIARTGAKTAEELATHMAGRAGKVTVITKALGLSDEAAGAVVKLVQNGNLGEEAVESLGRILKTLGREKAETIAKVLSNLDPKVAMALFKNEKLAGGVMSMLAEMVPRLTKLGIAAADIGAKLGKGLLKALPALGIGMSAADTIRTKTIAITGEWTEIGLKGLGKKTTYNADARGLAAIAGVLNGVDTALAVAEWALPGMGPILTALPNVGLALTEVALDVMMDHYNEHPMPADMKNMVEVSAYALSAATLDVGTVLALNDAYGKAAEHSGKLIAQLALEGKHSPAKLEHFITEISQGWVRNSDATRSFMQAIEAEGVSVGALMARNPAPLTQHTLTLLFDNLDSSINLKEKSSADDYARMEALMKAGSPAARGHMINRLLNQHTNATEEKLIMSRLIESDDAALKATLRKTDVALLAGKLSQANHKALLDRVVKLGDPALLGPMVRSDDLSQTQGAAVATDLIDKGVDLSPSQRLQLFERLSRTGGDVRQLQTLISGNLASGGKLSPLQDKETLARMLDLAGGRLGAMLSSSDPKQAAAMTVTLLLHGSKAQIEKALTNLSARQNFGSASEIVRTALTQAKAQGIDLHGKLSHKSLQAILGSLNNGWTQAFRAVGGKEHKQSEDLLVDLARISDVQGKAGIIQDMMNGWTPTTFESKIATILRETTDPAEFTRLVNQLEPASLSKELGNRKELGQVMAAMLERYQGDKNELMQRVMWGWSSASVQSDDILHAMIKQLETDGKLDLLKGLSKEVLDEMIDFTDDAFRDGRLTGLDAESKWSIAQLQAAKH